MHFEVNTNIVTSDIFPERNGIRFVILLAGTRRRRRVVGVEKVGQTRGVEISPGFQLEGSLLIVTGFVSLDEVKAKDEIQQGLAIVALDLEIFMATEMTLGPERILNRYITALFLLTSFVIQVP